jgi:hypothetical protein
VGRRVLDTRFDTHFQVYRRIPRKAFRAGSGWTVRPVAPGSGIQHILKERNMSADDSKDGNGTRDETAPDAKKDANDEVLKLMQGGSAVNLRIVVDDAVSLRNDNNKMLTELKVLRDKGITDLKEAYLNYEAGLQQAQRQNDAILKYTQDKGASDMRKVNDQNKFLRHYNDYAREWISGNYSASPDRQDPAEEQNDDEKLLN